MIKRNYKIQNLILEMINNLIVSILSQVTMNKNGVAIEKK